MSTLEKHAPRATPTEMQELISVKQAMHVVDSACSIQPAVTTPADEARGMTTARQIRSSINVPPFRNSAMDGFAVRTEDISAGMAVRIVGEIPAGASELPTSNKGECVRIMTGAPVPPWADAVIPIEWVEDPEAAVIVPTRGVEIGANVRGEGGDLRVGSVLLETGVTLDTYALSMLAYGGEDSVSVRVPPTVAIITTGDELVQPGRQLKPGQIYNSNGRALQGACIDAGAVPLAPVHANDSAEDIDRAIAEVRSADMIIFSGGVSVGKYDLVKQVLDGLRFDMLFWKVRQRPGKPLAFGRLGDQLVFGLPGNPVSSAVCFDQYVRPAIGHMLGRSQPRRTQQNAKLEGSLEKSPNLHYFARGQATTEEDAILRVRLTGKQGSNIFSSLNESNCLIHLPEGVSVVSDGTIVAIEYI